MTKLARRAPKKEPPSRAVWFAIGAASTVGAFFAYLMMWSGILGVPTGLNPARPRPSTDPQPQPADS